MDPKNLKKFCRLCLNYKLEPQKNADITCKIEKYLHIKLEHCWNDNICSNCYNSIDEFHQFYEKVHENQKLLYEVKFEGKEQLRIADNNDNKESENQAVDIGIKETEPTETGEFRLLNDLENAEQAEKNSHSNVQNETVSCSVGEKKLKASALKKISSETEKKMLEFYNIKCEKCEDCTFTSFKMLSKHYVNVHNTQGYIKCCKRNIRVNDKYYLRSHMYKHLQPDSCRCRLCGKELSSPVTLKHHMILHKPTEERPFQCRHCDKRFCCKNDLKNHEKAIHIPENEREDFICDVCGKIFQKVSTLRYHYSTIHLQEKKFICEVCAKCFTTQSGLRTHLNAAHSSLDPIQCQDCQKWLKTKDTFQKHLQLHQNNQYPCVHCDKICNSSASLRSHLVKHSNERPYSCGVCRKSFKTKTHLKNHSTQHMQASQYKCPYCSKVFVNMSNYYTHRRRLHSNNRRTNGKLHKTTDNHEALKAVEETGKSNFDSNNEVQQGSISSSIRQNIIVSPTSVKYV